MWGAEDAPARGPASWAVRLLGLLIAVIGLILAVGGVWLAVVGGSLYYVLAGIGLIIAGVLLMRLRLSGVWVYGLVFVATFVWALWEAGPHGWPLLPRLFGPAVLMALVILAAMALTARAGRRIAGVSFVVFVVAAVIFSIGIYANDGPAAAAPLPPPHRA